MPDVELGVERESFPAEVRTWERHTLLHLMPPVLDENEGTITFYCSQCGKVKVVADTIQPIYRLRTVKSTYQYEHVDETFICPECEAENVS